MEHETPPPSELPESAGFPDEGAHDLSSSALLKVLEEKDKLIVSLKEASTRRDKLNEQQIRLLSVDNQKKEAAIRGLQQRLRQVEAALMRRNAELAVLRAAEEKVARTVEDLKGEIERYKKGLADAFADLDRTVREEFRRKDRFVETLTAEFQGTIGRLEKKLAEVEEHYAGVLEGIAAKQGEAKLRIRQAIDLLQDAMALLDLGRTDLLKPRTLEEEVGRIVDETKRRIGEAEEEVRKAAASEVVIRNIENVNIRLAETPGIERLVAEIGRLQGAAREELAKLAGGEGSSGAASQPAPQAPRSSGGKEEQRTRTIIDRDNFAPFDWKRVLSDLQLTKYRDLIKVCDEAIRAGDLVKAIKLFKTIRDQPGILDNEITTKMIDDEIAYLEKAIKDRYMRRPESAPSG